MTNIIKIQWLSDSDDCSTCGPSYAEGAEITMPDGSVTIFSAIASCYDVESYDSQYVYEAILYKLGYKVYGTQVIMPDGSVDTIPSVANRDDRGAHGSENNYKDFLHKLGYKVEVTEEIL